MSSRRSRYMEEDIQFERSIVKESHSYEWVVTLPYSTHRPTICSPKFSVLNSRAHFFISMDLRRRYTVKLHFNVSRCSPFNFTFTVQNTSKVIFKTSGRHYATECLNLLTFDERELRHLREYAFEERRQLKFIFCINEFEIRYSKAVEQSTQTMSYMNAGTHPGNLADDFQQLLKNNKEGDIVVTCGKEVVKAHSFVFQTRSKVLGAMIRNDGKVKIKSMNSGWFKDFMRFVYTDIMPELDYDKAMYFYDLGDMYALEGLMRKCADFLIESLTPTDACECLVLADKHSDQYLKRSVIEYILDNEIYLLDELWMPFCDECPSLANQILNETCRMPSNKRRMYKATWQNQGDMATSSHNGTLQTDFEEKKKKKKKKKKKNGDQQDYSAPPYPDHNCF